MYRAALTYHPEVGTFRPGRGAWRVQDCWWALPTGDISTRSVYLNAGFRRALFIDSPRRLQPGSWINPRSLLPRSSDAAR